MLNLIDISDDQGVIDWAAVKASGQVDGVYAQATEGLSVVNSTYRANHDGCKASGIPFGPYHFLYCNDDGAAQAEHLLAFIDGYEGQLVPMVDFEQASVQGHSPADVIKVLTDFDRRLRQSLAPGKLPAIYFEYSLWVDLLNGYSGFAGHPAWPAAYNDNPTLDMSPTGWKTWTLWQWSDGSGLAPIPGITGSVDRDRFNGDSLARILR